MHEIIDKKFYLGSKFGTLINKKWITISELLQDRRFIIILWEVRGSHAAFPLRWWAGSIMSGFYLWLRCSGSLLAYPT
jgi:hypothetical protein